MIKIIQHYPCTLEGSNNKINFLYTLHKCPLLAECQIKCFPPQGQTVFTWSDDTLTTDERYDGRTSIVEPSDFNSAIVSVAINVSSLRDSDTGDYECYVTYSSNEKLHPLSTTPQTPLSSLQPMQLLTSTTVSPTTTTVTEISDGVRFRLNVQGNP